MYKPSDIKSPNKLPQDPLTNPNHLYSGFGKAQYEMIIQRLLESSQTARQWVSLSPRDFSDLFPDGGYIFPHNGKKSPDQIALSWLEQMTSETRILARENERFKLTELAIDALGKKYSVREKS